MPYRHVAGALRIPIIAAHGWDVLGARAAGMSAIWSTGSSGDGPFPTAAPPTASNLLEAAELARAGSD